MRLGARRGVAGRAVAGWWWRVVGAEQRCGDVPGLGAGRDAEVGQPGLQQAEGPADGLGVARCGLQPHDLLVQVLVVGVVAERGLQGSQGLAGVAGCKDAGDGGPGVLCVFRLLPHGFTNAVLRHHLAPLLGKTPDLMTSGQITYDLRRLRLHGLIERIPGTFRYQVTDTGIRTARFLVRVHDHVLRTGLTEITDPSPPAPTALRAADRAYQAALDDLTRHAGLAA
jgi:hypothetical protein